MVYLIWKSAAWLTFGLGLVGCASARGPVGKSQVPADPPLEYEQAPPTQIAPTPLPAFTLPDLGPAPDITNEVWLNIDEPLNLAALRGRVVLVEFWTFG